MTKILLVEDDKSLREIYGVRLMAEGYEIVSAGDGEEALAVAIKERPGLIVSDVMMPKISGFDMLDILRSTTETKDIKVIMMTALSSEDQRARGEALGADRYLVKSQVGIEDVVRTVHEVLGDGIAPAPAAPAFPTVPAPAAAPVAPTAAPAPLPVATPAPVAPEPQPVAPAPIPQPVFEQPVPAPVPAPVPEPIAPAPIAPLEPVPAPIPQPVFEQPAPVPFTPAPEPAPLPVIQPQPVAPAPQPIPQPVFEQPVPVPTPAPEPIAPAPLPQPITNPVIAPQQPLPQPGASTLPQPTAPFSSPRPASLGERTIAPLEGNNGPSDIAAQMNQALGGTPQPPTPPNYQ